MQVFHFYLHVIGSDRLEIFFEQFRNLLVFLIRHQTATNLGVCLGRQYGLSTFSRVTTPNTTHVKRRTNTRTLIGRESFFALHLLNVQRFFVILQIKRSLRHLGTFFSTYFQHVIIESGYRDMPLLILHIGNHLTQHVNRVRHRTPENTGMQISIRTGNFNLPVSQTSQSRRNWRNITANHTGIGNQNHISFQHILMIPAELGETRGTDFLFSLDHELHVTVQFPGFH